jgi:monofunctional biosynthetic peptidoglycan transglycosylase
MKGMWKKINFNIALPLLVMVILLCGIFMYFSHPVDILIKQFPHLSIQKDLDVTIDIKRERPKNWVPLNQVSHYAKWAIILSEDWSFYDHEGVDLEQVKVALSEMVEEQRFRGASTITQQMVKNVFLSGYPTLWRKFHEIILAQKVEKTLSKNRILEIYLNCIEFGPGIYGLKSAARHYFQKSPADLSPKEGAFLAMLLPSPKKYYVSFAKKSLTKFAKSRIQAILAKMRMAKVITPEHFEAEVATALNWER